jgi:hypothetical protein
VLPAVPAITWSQSYDFWIYKFNASIVVGLSVLSNQTEKVFFVFKTRWVAL